jgi:hypothetical protein
MSPDNVSWCKVDNISDVPSPALLLYRDLIETNVRQMITMARGPVPTLRLTSCLS